MKPETRNLVLVAAIGLLFFFGYNLLVLLPLFLDQRGVELGAIGLLMAVMPLTAMLLRPFSGQAIASFGSRPVLIASSILYTLLMPAFLLVTPATLWLFVLLRALQGIGIAGVENALNIIASNSAAGGQRAKTIGRVSVFFILGWALAPPAAEFLYLRAGFNSLFWLGSACCLGAAVASTLLAPQSRERQVPFRFSLLTYGRELLTRDMQLLLGVSIILGIVFTAVIIFLPLYAEARGIGAGTIFFVFFCIGSVVLLTVAGGLSDRIGRRKVLIPTMLFYALGPLLLVNLSSVAEVAASGLVFGVGDGLYAPALVALVLDLHPGTVGAVGLGLIYMAIDVGSFVGAAAFGFLSAQIGFGPAFAALASLMLVAALLIALVREPAARPAPAETQPAPAPEADTE